MTPSPVPGIEEGNDGRGERTSPLRRAKPLGAGGRVGTSGD